MSSKSVKFLIIGAGPTGIGAAYRLKDLGEKDFLVLDQASHVGGLAASFQDQKGFTWDIGGHVQFSHYSYFDQAMLQSIGREGWLHHVRESWAWMQNRFVPYPVQNNIRYFTKDVLWKCLQGMVAIHSNPNRKKPSNFKEWIFATFGEGFADAFMLPYNYKVWAYPAEDMSYQWVGERVSIVDLGRVLKNVIHDQDDISWGPNHTFQFPKKGGTGQIWTNLAEQIGMKHFLLEKRITEVNYESKKVKTADGGEFTYENLVSTIPLDLLCQMVKPALPQAVMDASKQLVHSSSNIVGIGLKGAPSEKLKTKCWMYFPEGDCPFYRVTVFSNYSPNNVPLNTPHWSLMTETSESPKKKVDRAKLIEETIQGCIKTGLIQSASDVVSTWMYTAEYGYPTPSLGRDQALQVILPALDRLGVFSRGRFGAYKYEVSNQDHSFMQGVEWVNRVRLGIPETTLFFPETANSNWGKTST